MIQDKQQPKGLLGNFVCEKQNLKN